MPIGIYCLDVGQGSCAAIVDRRPGKHAGQYQASLIDVGCDGDRLADWLWSIGVRFIPLIALTHNDEDHVLGLPQLVQRFRRRVGRVLFLIDRDPAATPTIPFYVPAQDWVRQGLIQQTGRLETPQAARPGMGAVLIQEPEATYRLHCAFPTMQQTEAVLRGAPLIGRRTGRNNPNATSGVVRLARPRNSRRTRVLFGGDLDYRGWNCMVRDGLDLECDVLVAPHHGAPRGLTSAFGPVQLADATQPRYILVSVGTNQRFVRAANESTARHPLPDFVSAFRARNARVLCTQITGRCADAPDTIPGQSVLPLPSLTDPHALHPSGSACAGTILVELRDDGRLVVSRLADHQTAVDGLVPLHHPLCRL